MDLAATERAELAELEMVIDRGMATFVEVGHALMKIRDSRLYRETYSTFEAYIKDRWGFERQWAYDQINAARVSTNVLPGVQTALPVRTARALAPLPADDQARLAPVVAEQTVAQAEKTIREFKAKNGVGRTYNKHPEVMHLTERLAGLQGRWKRADTDALTPPQARKQLAQLRKATDLLAEVIDAVEYRSATLHSYNV